MPPRGIRDEWLLPTLTPLLTPEAFEQLKLSVQDSYWESAVRSSMLRDDEIIDALATRFRMKIADLTLPISPQVREIVPEAVARKYRVLPLSVTDSAIDIATSDPHDLDAERALAFATGRSVRQSLASPVVIAERIEELYRPENAVEKILEGVTGNYDIQAIEEANEDDLNFSGKAAERPVIRLVDHILAEGITSRASDIHLEPEETGFAVRYRIDGVLRQVMTLPRAAGLPLVSRIKIMAGMDIADRMRPQDGRARVMVNGARIDLRVSTLPASQGEKVVIRILDARSVILSLDSVGLAASEYERVQRLLNVREGIVLVTGPTGSGKTTTLYSALRQVQQRNVNIITVEDPVEYRLPGIVQVQVNEKAGLTFASALRSILRQDPDVVLIGEIRDKETALIAVQASLTGHLVFSTMHTIDAASSVTRLMDIGVENFKTAAALKGVIAQRLLRRLCIACKAPDPVPSDSRFRRWIPEGSELYRPVGCAECVQTGYRGRMAITEIMVVTPEVERLIAASQPVEQITRAARATGMRSLWEAAMDHVRSGTTSLEELERVLEIPSVDGVQADVKPVPRRSTPTPRGGIAIDEPVDLPPVPLHTAPPVEGRRPSGPSQRRTSSAVAFISGEHPLDRDSAAFQLVEDAGAGIAQPVVLLVEDEEPLRRVLRDLLERDGFSVVEAADGIQALDEIDRAAPDIVVLDLNLPKLDGYGVLKRLRARPQSALLPVVVLTAKGDEDSEVSVFEFGANDYLTKPFRPRALSARLRALLNATKA